MYTFSYTKGTSRFSLNTSDLLILSMMINAGIGSVRKAGGHGTIKPYITFAATKQNLIRIKKIFGDDITPDESALKYISWLRSMNNEMKHEDAFFECGNTKGYTFPEKYPPREHQKKMFSAIVHFSWFAICSDCGTGKTYSMLTGIDYLIQKKIIDFALVVCPLSILYPAWVLDAKKFVPHLTVSQCWIPSGRVRRKERILELFKQGDIRITNYETAVSMFEDIFPILKKNKVVVAIDESTRLKGTGPQSRTLKRLRVTADRRYIMTGTPVPNGVQDFWGQMFFLDNGILLEGNFYDFRQNYMMPVPVAKDIVAWRPKPSSIQEVKKIIAKRIMTFKLHDCVDLPPITIKDHVFELPRSIMKHYESMEDEFIVNIDDDEVIADNVLTRMMKLSQITGGFLIDNDGNPIKLADDTKMKLLIHYVEKILESECKVLIWAKFKCEIVEILHAMQDTFSQGLAYYGDIPLKKKNENLELFQTSKDENILILQPRAGSRGLTLVEANYSVYYSQDHDYELWYQSRKRIERTGQKNPQFIFRLIAKGTIDAAIANSLAAKERDGDQFLTLNQYKKWKGICNEKNKGKP